MSERKTIKVTVIDSEKYDGGFPECDKLVDFIAWANGILESIPAEHRAAATIDIDSTSGWEDSHYAHIEIEYRRPETDEEMAARVAEEAARRAAAVRQRERDERAMLAALKAKYGDPSP